MSTEHKPFIPSNKTVAELTFAPLLVGVLLGIVFGASSLFLVLKVGLTVSASIPVAVLSITVFRLFSKIFGVRKATILENNITQTAGSAGESIAFGVGVTMPALLILGYDMDLSRIMLVSILGGLLGILMMIPLRYALIVKAHGQLKYPEGTACAEVLIAGEKGGTSAKTVFMGFGLGLVYKFMNLALKLWSDVAEKAFGFFKGASFATEVSPELLGVGYIIGPRIACIMVAGGVLSSWVLIPMIKLFGDGLAAPLFPATKTIAEMSLHEIWRAYVLYIGAGAVAAGGIISLFQSMPTIVRGATAGLGSLKNAAGKAKAVLRVDQDLPMSFVLIGGLGLILAIWLAPPLHVNLLGAILIVMFGFLFVTVSSRLTGEIGSSSNPISGMTVATLLLTCLVFVLIGWTGIGYRITALSIAAIVCIAASNGGTTSQDLKTGFLVGATPKNQQLAILVGALTSAVVIGFTLDLLNNAFTIYSAKAVPPGARINNVSQYTKMEKARGMNDETLYHAVHVPMNAEAEFGNLPQGKYLVDDNGTVKYLVDPAINGVLKTRDNGVAVTRFETPKARLMSLIIDGILTQKLPWGLVLLGVAIALVLELCGISALPFAVGVYLPLSSSTPIFFGGIVRWLVEKVSARKGVTQTDEEKESGPGVLFSSGLIAGGSIAGIALAALAVNEPLATALDIGSKFPWLHESTTLAYTAFGIMAAILFFVGTSNLREAKATSRK